MITSSEWWKIAIVTLNFVVFGYFVIVNTTYLGLFVAAFFSTKKYIRRKKIVDLYELFRSPLTPSISVIIPAFNEQATIIDVVRAALVLKYPSFEVVVVSDGSSDGTVERLIAAYDLKQVTKVVECHVACEHINTVYISAKHDNLVVVDKQHGGKPSALNAGINVSRGDIVCTADADSLMEQDALLRIARPFIEKPDETVAAGGVIRVINGCTVDGGEVVEVKLPRGYWANVQIVDYLRAFLGGRMGWASMNALLIVPGAFGAFDRRTLLAVGGFSPDTVGEDMELVLRIHKHMRDLRRKYRIVFIPDVVCWTQVPEKYVQVARQRDRWQRGMIGSLRGNEYMLFNPRYRMVGLYAYPFYFFFEMLGPIVELLGYAAIVAAILLGLLQLEFLWLFLALAILYGIIVSLMGIALSGLMIGHYPRLRSLAQMAAFAVLDNVGYRQVNTWWRTKAYVTYYTRKAKWGHMERSQYQGVDTARGTGDTTQF